DAEAGTRRGGAAGAEAAGRSQQIDMSATAASRRRRSFAAVLRRYGWSYIFVLPTFSLFVVFTLLPVVQVLVLSLQNGLVTGGEVVGVATFDTVADDAGRVHGR